MSIAVTTKRIQWRLHAGWVAGLVVSYLLLLSAISHLNNPYRFLESIYEYRLLPRYGAEFVAVVLPFLHIAISLCLIAGHEPASTFAVGCCLFLLYAGAQVFTLVQGIEVDCGCFGGIVAAESKSLVGSKSIGLAAFSAFLCLFGWWASSKPTQKL